MADYSQQIAELNAAAEICRHHAITRPVNGIQPAYPRWPEAFKACEAVWRAYLEVKTMSGPHDEDDRQAVINEASKLR
jgi:hypothetical protein